MARECKVGKIDFLGLAETRMIEEHSLIEGYRIVGKGKVEENDYNGVGLMYRMSEEWEVCEEVDVNERAKQRGLEGRLMTFTIEKGKELLVLTVVYNYEGGGRQEF